MEINCEIIGLFHLQQVFLGETSIEIRLHLLSQLISMHYKWTNDIKIMFNVIH